MADRTLPDTELLRQLLEYDATTGALTWRNRPLWMFEDCNGRTALNCCAVWNGRYAGTRAGVTRTYIDVKILGTAYKAHRVIWKLMTGSDPNGEIDHINRDKIDNRWENLRDVTRSQNMLNKPRYRNNNSGQKHIYWLPSLKKWTVQLVVPGKGRRQVAWAETLEEAIATRDRLYREFGYDLEDIRP